CPAKPNERACASLDLFDRAGHRLRVRVEDRDGPARRCAERRPAHADVAGPDHGDLAWNRHAMASSAGAPTGGGWGGRGSTRSNRSRRTGAGFTSMATRVNEPLESSF